MQPGLGIGHRHAHRQGATRADVRIVVEGQPGRVEIIFIGVAAARRQGRSGQGRRRDILLHPEGGAAALVSQLIQRGHGVVGGHTLAGNHGIGLVVGIEAGDATQIQDLAGGAKDIGEGQRVDTAGCILGIHLNLKLAAGAGAIVEVRAGKIEARGRGRVEDGEG